MGGVLCGGNADPIYLVVPRSADKELARLLRWEKSRLSQHLGRMQTRGLLSREQCLDDRRGAVVAITSRGTELIEAAAPQHTAAVRSAIIDQLTTTELTNLTAITDKVRKRLEVLDVMSRQVGQPGDGVEGSECVVGPVVVVEVQPSWQGCVSGGL